MAFGAAGGRVRGSGSEGGRHVARGLDRLTQALSACPARRGLRKPRVNLIERSEITAAAKRSLSVRPSRRYRATSPSSSPPLRFAGARAGCGATGRPAMMGRGCAWTWRVPRSPRCCPGNVFRRVLFWLPYMGVSDCVDLVAESARRGAGVDVRPAVRSAFCEASRRAGDRRGCRGGVGGARHAGVQVRVGSHAGAAAGVGVALRRVAVRLQLGTRTPSSGVVNARPG